MYKNGCINVLKMLLVAGLTGLGGLGVSTFAMENFKETDYLFDVFSERSIRDMKQGRMFLDIDVVKGMYGNVECGLLEKWKEDFSKIKKVEHTMSEEDYEDFLVNEIRNTKLNRLRLMFEQTILNYFFTKQERDNYKNNHKEDYSLDREFDDLFMSRINRHNSKIKFVKEAIFDYLINTYLNMVSHYGDSCDGWVKNVFKVVFKDTKEKFKDSEDRQQIKIHFSPQMFSKRYLERYLAGNIKEGKEDYFSSPENFKKLCFEIRDEKKPDLSIYLACSLYDIDKNCRFYGEKNGCCECRVMFENVDNASCLSVDRRVKNRYWKSEDKIYVPNDFMIVYGWMNVLAKNNLKLEDKQNIVITVYDDVFVKNGKISSLGNVLYSEKIKAYSQKAANVVDSAYKNNVAHTQDFDVIFWLKYYFHNLHKQNIDQLKDLRAKPKLEFYKYNKNLDYKYADL